MYSERVLRFARNDLIQVINHGDFHSNNIVFSKDGKRLRSVIDWQVSDCEGIL